MSKHIAVVISEDPRITARPVEALRIALGLCAGDHETTVILLGPASALLVEDTEEIIDADILEKYLPSLEHLEIPFILHHESPSLEMRVGFRMRHETDEVIRQLIQSMDSTIVF